MAHVTVARKETQAFQFSFFFSLLELFTQFCVLSDIQSCKYDKNKKAEHNELVNINVINLNVFYFYLQKANEFGEKSCERHVSCWKVKWQMLLSQTRENI